MAQVEPLKVAHAVRERLMGLVLSNTHFGQISQFERARMERELASIEKWEAGAAFELRAMIAQLDGDIEAADAYAIKAIHLHDPHAVGSRLFAFANLGYASRGLEYARESMRAGAPDLSQRFDAAIAVGAVTTLMQIVDASGQAGQGLASAGNHAIDVARKTAQALVAAGHTEDELAATIDVAGEVQREHRLFWLDRVPRVISLTGTESEDSGPGVHYLFRVGVSPEEAIKMTGEVGWRLVDRDLMRPALSVSFVGSKAEAASA